MHMEGDALGVFVLHFHNRKCHRIADGEMFPIRMRKLDNISVRQTYRWIARFVCFLPERDYVTFGSLLSQFRPFVVCLSVYLSVVCRL